MNEILHLIAEHPFVATLLICLIGVAWTPMLSVSVVKKGDMP